ncbi:MAG: hypothetical protein ABEJ86_03290 [Halococcoides sp.]
MAIEWVARRLLDWIDLDHDEATDALPGSLAESLPQEVTDADETAPPVADRSNSSSGTPPEGPGSSSSGSSSPSSASSSPAPSSPDDESGGSRLRRFGPYLLGLAAAVAAFGTVLGIVRVVRGWIEELRVGYTPMSDPSDGAAPDDRPADPDRSADRSPAGIEPRDDRRPGSDSEGNPPRPTGSEAADGDVLAAMAGLAFHTIVDRVVSEPTETDATTIPVETEE